MFFMLRGRSQVALEFLLTYGWALLIVVVVFGAFSYFLLFDSDELLPNSCNLGVGLLSCDDVVVSENGVFLLLSGTQHTVVQVVGVEVSLKGEEVVSCEKNNVFLTTSLGNPISFLVPCTMNLSEGRTDFDLSIDYVRAGTAFFKSINAQFSATVAAVQCVDVSECSGGEVCFAGFCVEELLVSSCSSSSQCDANAMCVAGVCRELVSAGDMCSDNDDCVSAMLFVIVLGMCESLIIGGVCTVDGDCLSGACDTSAGVCGYQIVAFAGSGMSWF